VSSAGEEGNGKSSLPSISADGRFVAFVSHANNLVASDTNASDDIFVHDRQTGATERVSVSTAGAAGNDNSSDPWISADGRYVCFHSDATNLVASDTNAVADVFVHDRQTGATERVSVSSAGAEGNDVSDLSWISADSRYVSFTSDATNLVAGDTNAVADVFVHDRQTGATERVSVSSAGAEGDDSSGASPISADGRFVVFMSDATNLVAGDTNGYMDVFVRDRQAGTTERVSVSSAGAEGNDEVWGAIPYTSADGRFVAFLSKATNMVPDDTNNAWDIFVRDRDLSTTERVSLSSAGDEANGLCYYTSISADGRVVAFGSYANNLVPGDANGSPDIFVRYRELGVAVPEVVLEVHPNERGPGPTAVTRFPGLDYWTWPALASSSVYTWKQYDFDGSASLWIQVCAQNFSAYQNSQNASLAKEDWLKLIIDGVVPADVWGIQGGSPGGFQWPGSTDKGTRVTLEFLPAGLTPGLHQLKLVAQMSPIIYWVKVYDLEPK
jgi:Tol biopolymer transport system component